VRHAGYVLAMIALVGASPAVLAGAEPTPQSNTSSPIVSGTNESPGPASGQTSSGASQGPRESDMNAAQPSTSVPSHTILSIRESTQIVLPTDEVSAAYSLDPLIAEAEISEQQLRIWGRAPGTAVIVLVHADFSTSSLQVGVTQAPPILPERDWSDLTSNGRDSNGYYEARLSSDPLQVSDTFDYRAARIQLHFNNANAPGRNLPNASSTWFPYTYLRILGDHWRLTLLDETVESSPISVSATQLRGMHFTAGGLALHVGYVSVAGFQSLFLPASKQLISGATFTHNLGSDLQIGVTGYFLQRDPAAFDQQAARGLGTLFLKRRALRGFDLSAEVGASNGVGGAFNLTRDLNTDHIHIAARYRPRYYAASDTDNLNGLQSEARWDHIWGERFVSTASGSANRFYVHADEQTTEVTTGNLQYRTSNGMSISWGVSASHFSDSRSLFPDIRRFALPVILSYDRARFGVSGQYEYSQTSRAFSAGQGYRGSLRWNGRHFQINANAGLDTQALGIDSVFSAFPALNAALAQLGLGATTSVEQLAALLNNRAFLNNLGIAPNATLELVPRNWRAGLNMSMHSARQQLELDSNYNLNEFLTQRDTTVLQTIRYRRGLSNSTELITSFTLLESIAPARRWNQIWEIGMHHQFVASPIPLWHQHNGTISGRVRLQDSSGNRPMEAVEITLDGDRRTASDSQGLYHFFKVAAGPHVVQLTFKSSRSFWYSTPSKVTTAADSIVDFGIIFPEAQINCYALNDAGIGLDGIGVSVNGRQGELNFTTDQTGKFVVPVAQTGEYVVAVNAATVSDGYALEDLQPVRISVGEGELKKVTFILSAIRALTGSIQTYDSAKEEYVPMVGVTVELAELNRQTVTDNNGKYSFRDLPSGSFTILVDGQPRAQVELGPAPQLLRKNIQLNPSAVAMTDASDPSR
jgi:hypothetical protein